jgi:multicomponent Na+:H+ antiporter subunit C
MIGLVVATLVAALLSCGTYLILQRSAIRMVVGLGLLTHGVNLLLFGTGELKRGQPPIVVDKAAFTGDVSQFVDPLPQALILTAIVISFGITAFLIALFNRRNALDLTPNPCANRPDDPFTAPPDDRQPAQEDYAWLEDSIARRQST